MTGAPDNAESLRAEEHAALQSQLAAAHHADRDSQLDTAVQMIAELLQVDYMEAGRRVAERQRAEKK